MSGLLEPRPGNDNATTDSEDTDGLVEKKVSDGEVEWLKSHASAGNDKANENLESGYIKLTKEKIGADQQKVTYKVSSDDGYSQTYVMICSKSLDQNTLINKLIKPISSDLKDKGKMTIKITKHKYGVKKAGKAGGAGYSGASRQALAPYLLGGGAGQRRIQPAGPAQPGQALQSQRDSQVRPAAPAPRHAPHPAPFLMKLPQQILQSETKDGKETLAEKIPKIVSRLAAIRKETDQIWKEMESKLHKNNKEMEELQMEVALLSRHLDQ